MFYFPDSDPAKAAEFWACLEKVKGYFSNYSAADNIITFDRNYSFSLDPRFTEVTIKHATSQQDLSLFWRMHVLIWCALQAKDRPGDFVECGVYRGYSSKVICDYLDFGRLPKQYFLYDTFWGLPDETSTPEERVGTNPAYRSDQNVGLYDRVCQAFAPYANVRVVQGVVPQSFEIACPEQIAFLHLDMNAAQAEIMALEVLYDHVVPGGFIILDDFGWLAHRPQMTAAREFFGARGKMVLELPTGQGIVLM